MFGPVLTTEQIMSVPEMKTPLSPTQQFPARIGLRIFTSAEHYKNALAEYLNGR